MIPSAINTGCKNRRREKPRNIKGKILKIYLVLCYDKPYAKEDAKEEIMRELRFAGHYVSRHWLQYLLGILALFVVDAMNVYVPQFAGEITDGLAGGLMGLDGVMRLVWRIVFIGAVLALFSFRRGSFH